MLREGGARAKAAVRALAADVWVAVATAPVVSAFVSDVVRPYLMSKASRVPK